MILKQNGHEKTGLPREKQERKVEPPIEFILKGLIFGYQQSVEPLKAVNTKNAREI